MLQYKPSVGLFADVENATVIFSIETKSPRQVHHESLMGSGWQFVVVFYLAKDRQPNK